MHLGGVTFYPLISIDPSRLLGSFVPINALGKLRIAPGMTTDNGGHQAVNTASNLHGLPAFRQSEFLDTAPFTMMLSVASPFSKGYL